MKKEHAIERLGGSVASAAAAIGISSSAISQWPEVLPPRLEDRMLAAFVRKQHPKVVREFTAPIPNTQASPSA